MGSTRELLKVEIVEVERMADDMAFVITIVTHANDEGKLFRTR